GRSAPGPVPEEWRRADPDYAVEQQVEPLGGVGIEDDALLELHRDVFHPALPGLVDAEQQDDLLPRARHVAHVGVIAPHVRVIPADAQRAVPRLGGGVALDSLSHGGGSLGSGTLVLGRPAYCQRDVSAWRTRGTCSGGATSAEISAP